MLLKVFILKSRTVEQRKDLDHGNQQERAYVCSSLVSYKVYRKEVSQGRAAFSSRGSQTQNQISIQDELLLPDAPLVASLTGTFSLGGSKTFRPEKMHGNALEGSHSGPLSREFFSLQVRIF